MEPQRFALAPDANGTPTVWLMRGMDDPTPMAVLSETDLSPNVRHLWPTVAFAILEAGVLPS